MSLLYRYQITNQIIESVCRERERERERVRRIHMTSNERLAGSGAIRLAGSTSATDTLKVQVRAKIFKRAN
jgi:hypothetical protein